MTFSRNHIAHRFCASGSLLRLLSLVLCGVLLALLPGTSQAQGTAQFLVSGIPTTLPSPYIADFIRSYEQGQYPARFIYTSPSRLPRSFRFRFVLERDGELLVDVTSEPNTYTPGLYVYNDFNAEPALSFPVNYLDWIGQIGNGAENNGVFPEGNYTLTIEAVPEDPNALIPTIPSVSFFTVRYADPPVLLTPFDQVNMNTRFPVFTWTPILGAPLDLTLQYEFLLVEVLPGQIPYQAIESNRELVRTSLFGQTTFVFSPDLLPLEPGRTYAWQVRAFDASQQFPVLEQGLSDVRVFTIETDNPAVPLDGWSFPINNPFLTYSFPSDNQPEPDDEEFFLTGVQPIELAGIPTQALFNDVLIDAASGAIISGSVVLQDPLSIAISINPLTDRLEEFEVVSPGTLLEERDAMILDLAAGISITNRGIIVSGTQPARVAYSGEAEQTWNATYSNDFRLAVNPIRIDEGRIDFVQNSIAKAYTDRDGFHAREPVDPLVAELPDHIPAPDVRMGRILLKRGDQVLVQTAPDENGNLRVTPLPGQPLFLEFAVLQTSTTPLLPLEVTTEELLIDPQTGQIVSGSLTAAFPDSLNAVSLDPAGIPFAVQGFTLEQATSGAYLQFSGIPTLLGQPVRGAPAATATLLADGQFSLEYEATDIQATIPLSDTPGITFFAVDEIQGIADANLLNDSRPQTWFESNGAFLLQQDSARLSTSMRLVYEGFYGITSQEVEYSESPDIRIPFGETGIQIRSLDRITLDYHPAARLQYLAQVSSDLTLELTGQEITYPLHGLELREAGLFVPDQDIHRAYPDFPHTPLTAGDVSLLPLGIRIDRVILEPSVDDSLDRSLLNPKLDFEIQLSSLEAISPTLAHAPLTLQNLTQSEDTWQGDIVPFALEEDVALPLARGTRLELEQLAGQVMLSAEGIEKDFNAMARLVQESPENRVLCHSEPFTIALAGQVRLAGSSADFSPCQPLPLGTLLADFSNLSLDLVLDSQGIEASVTGALNNFSGQPLSSAAAEGSLSFNLSTGQLIDANIVLERLAWNFPAIDPWLTGEIEEATLTASGLSIPLDTLQLVARNGDSFKLVPGREFGLGLQPELQNTGEATLYTGTERIGRFDQEGFSWTNAPIETVLADRILLDPAAGAFIEIRDGQTGDLLGDLGRQNGAYTTLTLDPTSPAQLVFDGAGLSIPITGQLELTDAGTVVRANIDLATERFPLFERADSRIIVEGFNRVQEGGILPSLMVSIELPDAMGIMESELSLRWNGSLFEAPVQRTEPAGPAGMIAMHPTSISLDPYEAQISITGTLSSSLLQIDGPAGSLPYEARLSQSDDWRFRMDPAAPRFQFAGAPFSFLNEPPRISLDTETGLSLQLEGLIGMPSTFGPGLTLAIAATLNNDEVEVRPLNNQPESSRLFGGFLTLFIQERVFEYNPDTGALEVSLSGSADTRLNAITSGGRRLNFPTQYPFRNLVLNTDGTWEVESEADNLMADLPAREVIRSMFWIDGMHIEPGEKGINLSMTGDLAIPMPQNHASQRPSIFMSRNPDSTALQQARFDPVYPVTIQLDAYGRLVSSEIIWSENTAPSLLTTSMGPEGAFTYQNASILFNPSAPGLSSFRGAALIDLPDASNANENTDTRAGIMLGKEGLMHRLPGVSFTNTQSLRFHLPELAWQAPDTFRLEVPGMQVRMEHLYMEDPSLLRFGIAGAGSLGHPSISGQLPLRSLVYGMEGLENSITLEGAFSIGLGGSLIAYESACLPQGVLPFNSTESLTADSCVEPAALTIQPALLAGTTDSFTLNPLTDSSGLVQPHLENVAIDLTNDLHFSGHLTMDASSPTSLLAEGVTYLQTDTLSTSGLLLDTVNGPGFAFSFSDSSQSLALLPGFELLASGGGVYFNQEPGPLKEASLSSSDWGIKPLTVIPVQLSTTSDAAFSGSGLIQLDNDFLTLDAAGSFFNREDALSGTLRLVRYAGLPLQGEARLQLDFPSAVRGDVTGNFRSTWSEDAGLDWQLFGHGPLVSLQDYTFPGRFTLDKAGLLVETRSPITGLERTNVELQGIELSLWYDPAVGEIRGHSLFQAAVNMLSGYQAARTQLYGSLVESRDVRQIIGVNEVFADLPYIYAGALQPWATLAQNSFFAGDARYPVMNSMVSRSRALNQQIPLLSTAATGSLRGATEALTTGVSAIQPAEFTNPLVFSPDEVRRFGDQWLADEGREIGQTAVPEIFRTFSESLFNDDQRPEYQIGTGMQATSSEIEAVLDTVRTAVTTAQRSAEADIYTLESLAPKPLLWAPESMPIDASLRQSPITQRSWPGTENTRTAGFAVDAGLAAAQAQGLIDTQDNLETLDLQFIRAIGSMELNLVNLKIVHSPDQARDFQHAIEVINRYYTSQINADWALYEWAVAKITWLQRQRTELVDGIQRSMATTRASSGGEGMMKRLTLARYNHALQFGAAIDWKPTFPGESYSAYLDNLSGSELDEAFSNMALSLWYELPLETLQNLTTSLLEQLEAREAALRLVQDSVTSSYSRYTRALDPLYAAQTELTTLLYGVADEYRRWRAGFPHLDPDAVNFAFQFLPYRGNYRFLAEDLEPPVITSIRAVSTLDGFSSRSTLTWEADHAVELVSSSISIRPDSTTGHRFLNIANQESVQHHAVRNTDRESIQGFDVALRVRGAGGLATTHYGRLQVAVDPEANNPTLSESREVLPADETPPSQPRIEGLRYSSYFSEKPNVLAFQVAPLLDPESGIASMEYALFNAGNEDIVYQDWTPIPMGTQLFTGRNIETGISAQEVEPDIEVRVRATNGAGLTSMATERIALSLDESQPDIQIEQLSFIPSFSSDSPDQVQVNLNRISDPESGIVRIEYAFARGQEAQMNTDSWTALLPIDRPVRELELSPLEIPLPDRLQPDEPAPITLFIRVTNGAGLQSLDSRMIELPGKDLTPPSEPVIAIRQIPETTPGSVSIEVLLGESSDLESGVDQVLFRILNGSDGSELIPWQDFVFLEPSQTQLHLPRNRRIFTFTNLVPGATLIAEAQVMNRAGMASTKAIEFLSLFNDNTPPEPAVVFLKKNNTNDNTTGSLALVIGSSEDLETGIQSVAYRFMDPISLAPLQEWTTVYETAEPATRFDGQVIPINTLPIFNDQPAPVQVRFQNEAGLNTFSTAQLAENLDITPPILPDVRLQFLPSDSLSVLYMMVNEAYDPESSIKEALYRVINEDTGHPLTAGWLPLDLLSDEGLLETQITEIPILLEQPGNLRAEIRLLNTSGFEAIQRAIVFADPDLIVDMTPPLASEIQAYSQSDSTIQLITGPLLDVQSGIDSLAYRIAFSTPETPLDLQQAIATLPWIPLEIEEGIYVDNVSTILIPEPATHSSEGVIQVRVVNGAGLSTEFEKIIAPGQTIDSSPPDPPHLLVQQVLHDPGQSIPLTIFATMDKESALTRLEYRIINDEGQMLQDWTSVEMVYGMQQQISGSTEITPPDRARFQIEARVVNGAGLAASTARSISYVQDQTPPRIERPRLAFSNLYQEFQPARLTLTLPRVADPESRVQTLAYRLMVADSSRLLTDWTMVPIIASHDVSVEPIPIDLPNLIYGEEIRVDIRVENEKGLTSQIQETRILEVDRTPPLAPNLEVDYIESSLGGDFLQMEAASFRDVESGVTAVAYRITDTDEETVHLDWTPIPLFRDIRITTPRVTIPKNTFDFEDTRPVRIEVRATNGAGLHTIKTAQVLVPGDNTAPEKPQLLLAHRNGYAPQNPNTLEIQIAPLSDPQSTIQQVSYRVVDPQNDDEILSWTDIPLIDAHHFPGSLQYVSLEGVNRSSTLAVEVQVTNRAGLQIATSDNIDIAIVTDRSPPVADISLHYFSSEMALVFEELMDRESNIQQVEYRFVDNVDQSVLADWQDLFEIALPQQEFPRQSFTIPQPPSRTGRTIKVEVRITNGAGLQSLVSKTILFRQGGDN